MYIYIIKIKKDCDVNLGVLKNIIFYNANINNNSSITLFVPAALSHRQVGKPKNKTQKCDPTSSDSRITLKKKDFFLNGL